MTKQNSNQNHYQQFAGKVAIKSEMAEYLFKKFSQWMFKYQIDQSWHSSIQMNGKTAGNRVLHFCFPLRRNSKWSYDDDYKWNSNSNINICIYINGDNIEVRFYFDRNYKYGFSNPIVKLNFEYMEAYQNLNLFIEEAKQPAIENKQQMNEWLQQTIVEPITQMCNYFMIQKKLPEKYVRKPQQVDYFIKQYSILNFENNKYTELEINL